MIAYKYDETTKEYLGTQECQLDPMESKAKGKDVWLLPINCTFEIPPEFQPNTVPVFEDNAWVVKNDFRGKRAYNDYGLLIINYIGDLRGSDKLLTNKQIEGLDNGTLIWENGKIVKYVKPISELIAELEEQINELNNDLLRDIRVLLDPKSTEEDKIQAQSYYDEKMIKINELIAQINELKEK